MSSAPKILPMIAVAAGGVLAVKALANARLLPDVFAPKAVAETAAPLAPTSKALVSRAPATPAGTPAPPPPAPVCQRSPAELAKEAGLSPAELATLQNLGARRGQLDNRERALDTQLQLINAASAKLDGKLKAMGDLKSQIQALMGQADQQSQGEVDHLVLVYEKMKPRDAGALMAALDDKVRVPVAAKIAETKPAIMAAILSQMPTAEGKKLTELLAHRFTPGMTLAQALNGPSKPADAAVLGAAPAEAAAAAPAQAGPLHAARPVRAARRPRPRAPAKAAAPAETAKPTETAAAAPLPTGLRSPATVPAAAVKPVAVTAPPPKPA